MTYPPHTIAWYLRTLNALRRLFGRPEVRYLTDYEWRRHMDDWISELPPPACSKSSQESKP